MKYLVRAAVLRAHQGRVATRWPSATLDPLYGLLRLAGYGPSRHTPAGPAREIKKRRQKLP